MPGLALLLTIALSGSLSGLSAPGTANHGRSSWITATALSAHLCSQRGLTAHPALGYSAGQEQALAVVEMDAKGHVQAEVQTALAFFRMRDAARRAGVDLMVVSGFRTQEQQQDLFRLYRRGRGPLASKPGHSNHQSGKALDLDMSPRGTYRWLKSHAQQFGFKRTVPSERWHWEHIW